MDGNDGNHRFIRDTLANLVSNLGTSKDKVTSGQFISDFVPRTEIDSLYRSNPWGGKVVDIPADDMTREWRSFKADQDTVTALEETERKLNLRMAINRALKFAFKDGGSAIILGTEGDPTTELNVNAVRKGGLKYLYVVTRYDLAVSELIYDPASPWFGQAKEYFLSLADGTQLALHPSRVVPFQGVMRADAFLRTDPWGHSIYERLYQVIKDATSFEQAIASMAQECKLDIVKIPGLSENIIRPEYRAAIQARFHTAMTLKSMNNALIFDAEEDYSQKTLTFQGLPEVYSKLLENVAGAADMPVTRLLGQSPKGLNATGQADLEGYYSMLRARQMQYLKPMLDRIDQVLIRSTLGRMPRNLWSEFRTLWNLSETDQADIDQKRASAVEAYSRAGIFTPEALQEAAINQLLEDGFLPGIDKAVQANPSALPNVQIQAGQIAAESKAAIAAAKPAPTARKRTPTKG